MTTDGHLLTRGAIFPTLVKFSFPYLGASFLQALYGITDTLIVSFYGTPADLSAVSTGAQALYAVMCLIAGLTVGGTIVIGQYYGARRLDDTRETIATLFSFFGPICVLLSLIGMALTPYLVSVLQTPPEAVPPTRAYLFLGSAGLVFTFGYNAICAVLRGIGDAINPLKFIAVASLINVVLDLIFIAGFGWGAAGAAAATTLAQGISMILAVRFLKKQRFLFTFDKSAFQIHWNKLKQLLKIGLPVALQDFLIMLSFLIILAIVNKMGVIPSAAAGITEKIDGFTILPALSLSAAIAAMTAQNIGAQKTIRAKKTFYVGLLTTLVFSVPAFVLMFKAPVFVMSLTSAHPDIIRFGADYLLAYSADCLFLGVLFAVNGFLNGCGHTTFTMACNLITILVLRLPLVLRATDLFEVGLALPASAGVAVLLSLIYFYGGFWKKRVLNLAAADCNTTDNIRQNAL